MSRTRVRLMNGRLKDEKGEDFWIVRTETYGWDPERLLEEVRGQPRLLVHTESLSLEDLGRFDRARLKERVRELDSARIDLTLYRGCQGDIVVVEERH